MSQAMNTAMSGINANQLHISLVADNIANLNTTAYKESQMSFKDVWYQTKTTGTAPSGNMGGTNAFQIGVGTAVAAITRNFEPNNINVTGRGTDMALEGQGFFTVMDGEGNIFMTRDGNFSLDGKGNLVTSLGYKVLGTNSDLSLKSSTSPIQIPMAIQGGAYPQPSAIFANKNAGDLNNGKISSGNFYITPTDTAGVVQPQIEINVNSANTVQAMVDDINTQLTDSGSAMRCRIEDGALSFALDGGEGGDVAQSCTFTAGTSNFVQETEISKINPEGGAYTSTTLDYKVDIKPATDLSKSLAFKSMSVSVDGVIEATYENGDKITVWQDPEDGTKLFKYRTATGVDILGPQDVTADPNVLKPESLQIQCANVRNPEGLAGVGSNMYAVGPDAGEIIYGNANNNGVGNVRAGGLEASNVDLSRQFSNMIMAQRGIEANSRVFDTANNILQTLVYLGKG